MSTTKTTVLMDFYADWCAPCQRISPFLTHLAQEFQDRIRLIRVNVDTDSVMVDKYNIYSLPTVVFVTGGHETARIVGAKTEDEYRNTLIKTLRKRPAK